MKPHFALLLLAAGTLPAIAEQVSTRAFSDGAKHYRDGSGIEAYARHLDSEVSAIADNILLHQRSNGGWPANWDPQRVLSAEERVEVEGKRNDGDTTFDNRATYTQMEYLAAAFAATQVTHYRDAAVRGLEFMLAAQHPCGGFPHSFPRMDNYRPYITFMDDVTAGALTALRNAVAYPFLEAELRARVEEAVQRGTACVLQLQQWQGESLSVWAGQYDPTTLLPVMARPFEQPGLVSAESAGVVRYLMGIEAPSPEVARAIEGAIGWYQRSKLEGMRIESFDIEPVRFNNHTARRDVRVVEDPTAPPLWARFYELDTNRPFMANRDGIKVYALEDVLIERRTGYSWYGGYASSLLVTEYPAWKARFASNMP